MKRPTANVSGDNPGIQPLWPARSVTRRSFTSALLPSRIFPDWFLQYGYPATHLFWQLLTSFTGRGTGTLYPREYPFAVA